MRLAERPPPFGRIAKDDGRFACADVLPKTSGCLPYAGMTRFRFEGYYLSLLIEAPPTVVAHSYVRRNRMSNERNGEIADPV